MVDRKQQIKQDEEVSVSGVQQGGAVAPGSSRSETRTDQQSGRRIEKKTKQLVKVKVTIDSQTSENVGQLQQHLQC